MMDKNFRWILQIVTMITVFVIGLVGNIFVLIIVHKRNTRKTIHGHICHVSGSGGFGFAVS